MASGHASTTDKHVCRPPAGQPVGWLWYCPDCWSGFLYRPVACRELGGRVINLWVRQDKPGWQSVQDRKRAALRVLAAAGGP